jgi:hypothetical protein
MIVECGDCGAYVDAVAIASYTSYEEPTQTTGKYSFLKCPRCERPFIMLQTDGDGILDDDTPTKIYPQLDTGLSYLLPHSITRSFFEAQRCYNAKAYTATAVMCRKTLQAIAEEHKIRSRNLAKALEEMKNQEIIEQRLFEWADALRISGNQAAHDVESTISAQDARDILDFTKALLEYVFTFRDKFEKWKKRKQAQANMPKAEEDDQFT